MLDGVGEVGLTDGEEGGVAEAGVHEQPIFN